MTETRLSATQMSLKSTLIGECQKLMRPDNAGNFSKRVHWKKIRRFREDYVGKDKCELCNGEVLGADMHHRTYERIGRECIDDVILLCQACHKRIHMAGKSKDALYGE